MRLWDFAVAAYARPGVEDACLVLQDEHGQCVPLLLWRLWTLAEGRDVRLDLVAAAAEAARAWDEAAVAPLRRMRRRLKRAFPPIGDAARMALRGELKAAELQAERALLDMLESLSPPPGAAAAPTADALAYIGEAWGAPAPREALSALAAAVT